MPDFSNENAAESYGFGRQARQSEIDSLDHDISPDGSGLPAGSGTFLEGAEIYAVKYARCHGLRGYDGPFSKLVSNDRDTTKLSSDEKTIGNYWPYSTTLYDYINRAMPYDTPGSLSANEVYSVTAFILKRNNLIDSSLVIDARTLPLVNMPAKKFFVKDDRTGGPDLR